MSGDLSPWAKVAGSWVWLTGRSYRTKFKDDNAEACRVCCTTSHPQNVACWTSSLWFVREVKGTKEQNRICCPERIYSLLCGNKMPTRCNRGFYCRYCFLLNMFRASLCPSSGVQEYYTVVAACGISCCGFQVAGLVWSWGLCVWFAGYCSLLAVIWLRTFRRNKWWFRALKMGAEISYKTL